MTNNTQQKPDLFTRLEQLEYPHREICGLCHRAVAVGFWVPNEMWAVVVHRSRLQDIHCLNCFIERADEKLIDWSKDIKFYAISLRAHLEDMLNNSGEMVPFHEKPGPLPVEVEEYFEHCYGTVNLKDHIFDGRDMLDFAYGFAGKQQSRITELESRLRASNEYAERNGLPTF